MVLGYWKGLMPAILPAIYNNKRMQQVAQMKYKTRHVWVEKVVHWELCKRLNFDHTTKWYMQNPEYILENDT